MPEMYFLVSWPDGTRERCYSPSLVVREHLAVGESYPVADFVERCRTALGIASERVRERYGFPCRLALGQLDRIEAASHPFLGRADARVAVEAFED